MLIRTLPWVVAMLTVALWIPALARIKVPSVLEVAFYRGGLVLPIVGMLLAAAALRTKPRAVPVVALVANALLAALHLLLVGAPLS